MSMDDQQRKAISVIETAVTNAGKKVVIYLGTLILIGMLMNAAYQVATGRMAKDDTDGYKRSGLKLHTDYGTGCQYLVTTKGGITPRIAKDGTHHGCKEE